MIDTNKYKGHTPAPWYERKHYDTEAPSVAAGEHDILLAICGKGLKHHSSPQYAITRPVEEQEANAKLIADAPLLLAEVKRLREAIVDMIDSMDNYYIRDIQHATDCLRDMIGYYEDEEE